MPMALICHKLEALLLCAEREQNCLPREHVTCRWRFFSSILIGWTSFAPFFFYLFCLQISLIYICWFFRYRYSWSSRLQRKKQWQSNINLERSFFFRAKELNWVHFFLILCRRVTTVTLDFSLYKRSYE